MEAVNSSSTSIAAFKKQEDGETIAKAFLAVIVTELVGSFNVGKTMDAMQVAFAVNGIQSDYYFLKIDELKYCFENAKKGRYGTVYDRIDAAVIFGWIEKYLEERMEVCYQQNIEKNKAHNTGTIHPEVAASLKKFLDKKIEEKPIEKVKYKPRERTKEEKIIQAIFNEFDAEWCKLPPEPPGSRKAFRMIQYTYLKNDKEVTNHLSQEEYLQIRLEEMKLI